MIIMVANICVAIGCFIIGIIAAINVIKSESKLSKNYLIGISCFFILTGISRLIFFYHDFFAPDSLDILLWKIANSIMMAGFAFLAHTIETYVYKKTMHIFTITIVIFTLLHILMAEKNLASIFLYAAATLSFILPCLVYLIIAKKSPGAVRKKALIIIIGIFLIMSAAAMGIFVMLNFMDLTFSLIIGPPIVLTGFIITGYGFITMNR
ncbi:MAG: hypothetical protein ACP6IY_06200 [Promethearchaeia archaeon]